ncbi:CynX/NimT family MFS transporter [Virgibacillus sp. W0430]|uniref:CynX/NimT family MFS transporter n=1 Tax=Virgibacillus sp. W0430 TaxID=3391580 RepID=UPI003F47D31E
MSRKDNMLSATDTKNQNHILLFIGVVLIGFNLRPAITSVGPLMGMIRDDIGFSNWSVGLLTSLPLIAFAVISPVVPKLANRFSNEIALIIGLCFLFIGIGIRSVSIIFFLFLGTLFIGLGIAVCNVLLPGVVKEKYPAKVAIMTSIYSTAMGIFAASASGLSIPFAENLQFGWQATLLIWGIPAFVAIIIWVRLAIKGKATRREVEVEFVTSKDNRIWTSFLAWKVALYMGLQSFLFYVTISWLPEILHAYGVSIATAGWMLSYTQFIGLPASFFVPVIAARFQSQRWIVFALCVMYLIGAGGLLAGTSYIGMILSVTLIGISMSGCFALALSFLGMRARNARQSAELSGMAQSFGYSLAAIGPMLIGFLFDLTHAWTVPLLTLMIVSILVMYFGMGAGQDKYVLD